MINDKNYSIDYDKDADVLYINFHNQPLKADDAIQVGDIIYRYKDNKLIGITIIDFRKNCYNIR